MRPMTELPRPLDLVVKPLSEWQEKFVDPEYVNEILGKNLKKTNFLPGAMLTETFKEVLAEHGQIFADENKVGERRAVIDLGTQGSIDRYLVVESFKGNIVVWPLELKKRRFGKHGVSYRKHKFDPINHEYVTLMKSNLDGDMARYYYPRVMLGMNEKGAYAAMQYIHGWLKETGKNETAG